MKNQALKSKYYLTKHRQKNHICPNCVTPFNGNFCPNCGQSVDEVNKPFKDFVIDLLGSISAFDFRFWYSVKLMFTKPHLLSENYLNGKRARYMPPFRFYFFISFIFFFVINWFTDSNLGDKDLNLLNENGTITITKIETDSTKTDHQKNDTISVDSLFGLVKNELKPVEEVLNDSTVKSKIKDQTLQKDKLKHLMSNKESRQYFISKIYNNISWMIIILMPIFALILQLLYLRQNSYYVRHLVFAINTHSLVFIVLIVFFLLNHFLGDLKFEFHNYLLLLPPFYMILSMKKFYKQSWRKTIVKFFILTTLYNFVLLAALIIVFAITFGTY